MAKTLRKNNKGKDLPRYPVVVGYEKEFKLKYAKQLGVAINNIITYLNDLNPSSNTGIN